MLYCTYLGGRGDDRAFGIAVDPAGNAYVTGWTGSSAFPTVAPVQSTIAGGKDAFVATLNPAGNALIYSTYLGGAATDSGNAIAVDAAGNAYVAGGTYALNLTSPRRARINPPIAASRMRLSRSSTHPAACCTAHISPAMETIAPPPSPSTPLATPMSPVARLRPASQRRLRYSRRAGATRMLSSPS